MAYILMQLNAESNCQGEDVVTFTAFLVKVVIVHS